MSAGIVSGTLINLSPPVDPANTSHEKLKQLAGITTSIVAAAFIIWGVWILVRSLRAWRVRSATPGLHYIRTWYGWMDAKKHAEKVQTRQIRKAKPRSDRFSTGSTAEYSRICWDPSMEKRGTHAWGRRTFIRRFLPSWTRKYDGGSASNTTTSPKSLGTDEQGRFASSLVPLRC